MTNIYDIINELYTDDEGWNTVLERRYADQFLRTEAFRGATDDELVEIWQQVMYLLIYCGNTSYRIGDMTGEDFISYYAAFAISTNCLNVALSLTAISASIFLSRITVAFLRPEINLL